MSEQPEQLVLFSTVSTYTIVVTLDGRTIERHPLLCDNPVDAGNAIFGLALFYENFRGYAWDADCYASLGSMHWRGMDQECRSITLNIEVSEKYIYEADHDQAKD
jgi:hypothetical protein